MSSSSIPLPIGVAPPFYFDPDRASAILDGSGRCVGLSADRQDWIARVLTAYYTDPQPEPVKSVPQFVVVRLLPQGEAIVSTFGMFAVNNGAQCYCHDERITTAEYTRLKSILAPGQ